MQQVRWTAFGLSSAITKTVLHFFPSAVSTSAPYPVSVTLSVFSNEFPRKSLTIEGGRLGQPDGFRLEEAIPSLAEALPGFVGLQVELSTPQPRIDLSPSCCIIEFVSTAQSVKFSPQPSSVRSKSVQPDGEARRLSAFPLMQDAYGFSSLLIVNGSDRPVGTRLSSPISMGPIETGPLIEGGKMDTIGSPEVQPGSVAEVQVPDQLIQARSPDECSWGLVRSRVLLFERSDQPAVSFFGLFRESVAKRIVSVVAL
ncbi:MAG: hypothetical protein J5J00_15710 [Deltaproteobacteria bacterium]|nr:hypothetical protein [Deltaproteobacteria bacterium]